MARSARATARGKRARRRALHSRRARLVLGLISFAVGFVTSLFDPDDLAAGRFERIEQRAKTMLAAIGR